MTFKAYELRTYVAAHFSHSSIDTRIIHTQRRDVVVDLLPPRAYPFKFDLTTSVEIAASRRN